MKQVVSYQPLLESEDYDLGIVGRSEPMQNVFKLIGQLSASDATALITGESGTGKELVARAIYHHSQRARAAVPGHQLRGHPGKPAGKRAVRPRERRVHRRRSAAHRQVRAMPPRHDFPRRNRRHDARHADQDPARAAVGHVRARRRQPAHRAWMCASSPPPTSRSSRPWPRREFREDLFYRLNVVRIASAPAARAARGHSACW